MRLDNYLVEKGFVDSRNKAQALIKESCVKVDENIITKASFEVEEPTIEILKDDIYVSRAAYKLKFFLQESKVEIRDKRVLDIGSSTGGFCEVLLENGAKSITAVDVGKDQLHPKIKQNPKVNSIQECNIKDFSDEAYEMVTCDLSFVSTLSLLDEIDRLSKKDIIILFKPQFEVGKNVKRDRKGVVTDYLAIQRAMDNFEVNALKLDWQLVQKSESKLKGKDGNVEFFYHFCK